MEETALQVNQNSDIVLKGEEDYGYGGISSEGLSLPFIKLCQLTTTQKPASVNAGDFFNSITGKNYGSTIKINVFRSNPGRIKFYVNRQLECVSFDGISGSLHGECGKCECAIWSDDREIRKVKYCQMTKNFLCLVDGESVPGILSLSKGRDKVAKDLNFMLTVLAHDNQNVILEKRVPIYFYTIELTSFNTTYKDNTIFNIKISMKGVENDSARKQLLITLFREWKEYQKRASENEQLKTLDSDEVVF